MRDFPARGIPGAVFLPLLYDQTALFEGNKPTVYIEVKPKQKLEPDARLSSAGDSGSSLSATPVRPDRAV